MERKALLMKPKHQCDISQWVEWVYGAQSWKEKRWLCESVFILIDRWTMILKSGRERCFSYDTKASILLSQCGEWICGA